MSSPTVAGDELAEAVQACVDALTAALAQAGVPFGDGEKPAEVGNRPYIVGWWDAGVLTAHTLAAPAGVCTLVLTAHCAGQSPQAARLATARLAEAVHSLNRTRVARRAVGFPEQLTARPLTRDDDAAPAVFTQTVEWRLRLTPAR